VNGKTEGGVGRRRPKENEGKLQVQTNEEKIGNDVAHPVSGLKKKEKGVN